MRAPLYREEKSRAERVGYWIGQVLGDLLRAWLLMLLLGVGHHDLDQRIPALGYWATFLVLVAYDVLVTAPIAEGVRRGIRGAS